MEKQLKKYANEIGLCDLSLEDLINSHRHLRSLNGEFTKTRREIFHELRTEAYEEIKRTALENNFISIDKLKSMTISELVEFLAE